MTRVRVPATGEPSEWRTDTQALGIFGRSGAGKTTLARCLQRTYPGVSVFFDLDEEPAMGREVSSIEELRQALADGATEVCYRTPPTQVQGGDDYEQVVRFLIEIGNRLRSSGDGPMQFITDECQDVPDEWLQVAQKRLRKRRIKPVQLSQDPVSVNKRVRTQNRYIAWLSKPNAGNMDFLKQSNMPEDLLLELPDYDVLVFDTEEQDENGNFRPIGRFRAPEEYAHE